MKISANWFCLCIHYCANIHFAWILFHNWLNSFWMICAISCIFYVFTISENWINYIYPERSLFPIVAPSNWNKLILNCAIKLSKTNFIYKIVFYGYCCLSASSRLVKAFNTKTNNGFDILEVDYRIIFYLIGEGKFIT